MVMLTGVFKDADVLAVVAGRLELRADVVGVVLAAGVGADAKDTVSVVAAVAPNGEGS